jgi:hypothetical protein
MSFILEKKRFYILLLAAIWNMRNKITFDHLVIRSSMVTISWMCAFLKLWAGLYGAEDGDRFFTRHMY